MIFTELESRKSCLQRDPAGEPHPTEESHGDSGPVCVSLLHAHEWLYRPVTRKSAATMAKNMA